MDVSDLRRKLFSAGSAKRSLFGPVDHDETRVFLRRQMRILDDKCCKRWNFDFDNESPLEGRYEWIPADGDSSPPADRTLSEPAQRSCAPLVAVDTETCDRCQGENEPSPWQQPQQPCVTVGVQCRLPSATTTTDKENIKDPNSCHRLARKRKQSTVTGTCTLWLLQAQMLTRRPLATRRLYMLQSSRYNLLVTRADNTIRYLIYSVKRSDVTRWK